MNLLEPLENRRLYSTVTLASGVLTVTGTSSDDWIQIGKTVSGDIRVTENGSQTQLGVFAAASVAKVIVNGLGGNDNVAVHVHANKQVAINGGAGHDTLIGGDSKDTITGGLGNDNIIGNNNDDSLLGGEGNDTIKGSSGQDSMYGQGGNDEFTTDFNTGPNPPPVIDGNDVLSGGSGIDLANYATRPTNQNLTIDGVANDGLVASGEQDNILTDVENLKAGQGSDYILGSALANHIDGQGGNDTIYAGAGDDTVTGSNGNDLIYGQGGNDSLMGGDGNDLLAGGAGDDVLLGGPGTDFELQ